VHCLVTGASGYIGTALCAALQCAGHSVSGQIYRGESDLDEGRIVRCDLSQGLPAEALEGVDCVFHLAGIAHQQADSQAYQRVNLNATRDLAQAALTAGVPRFVFMSSVKAEAAISVSGGAAGISSPAPGSPTVPPSSEAVEQPLSYGESKATAEAMLVELCQGASMSLVILRPALVYSVEAPGHLRWLREWARLRLPRPPVGGQRSMISREDLVRLCVLLLQRPSSATLTLTVTDGEGYSTRRLHQAFSDYFQRQPLLPSPPEFVWRGLARLAELLRGERSGALWQRMHDDELYAARGLDTVGFSPRLTLERCLSLGS